MDKSKVTAELHSAYPGKTIICIPEDNPTEILCEIDPSSTHPEYSVVVSVIDKSVPHVHRVTVEEYEILRGWLKLNKDGVVCQLKGGDRVTVYPNEVHFALGDATWIKVTSRPGWTPSDHIIESHLGGDMVE